MRVRESQMRTGVERKGLRRRQMLMVKEREWEKGKGWGKAEGREVMGEERKAWLHQ